MFMDMAKIVSHRSTCPRKQVGAIIARDGRPISLGYNGAPKGKPHCTEVGCLFDDSIVKDSCIRAVHAELNAIAFAAREGISTMGCTMYVTVCPCSSCAKLIINAGITRVIYAQDYKNTAGRQELMDSGVVVLSYDRDLIKDECER